MRVNVYSDKEMFMLAAMDDNVFMNSVFGKSIDSALRLRKLMQQSLTEFSKKHKDLKNVQMAIVHKCMMIERYARPYIHKKHLINLMMKYPHETEIRYKELAKDLTEKTFMKMAY